jgi:hypothetical protein
MLKDDITADDFSLSSLDNFYDDSPIFNEGFGINAIQEGFGINAIQEGFGINAIQLNYHTLCNLLLFMPISLNLKM